MKKTSYLLIAILLISCQTKVQKTEIAKEMVKEKEEFPGKFQMMKWFFTGFPETYGGWKIGFKETLSVTGDTEGAVSYQMDIECDTCGLLPNYTYHLNWAYGFGNEDRITVSQDEDTTDKYFKLLYLSKDSYLWFPTDSATPHIAKEDTLFSIEGGGGDNGRTGAFCLKDRTIDSWFKGTQTKVYYSVIPEDSTDGLSTSNVLKAIYNSDNDIHPNASARAEIAESFAKRFSCRLNAHYPIEYFPTNAEEIKAIRIRKCGQ